MPDPAAGPPPPVSWFHALAEESPDLIAVGRSVLDPEGRLTEVVLLSANATCRRRWMNGLPEAEVVGSRVYERWPVLHDLGHPVWSEAVESGTVVRREVHVQTGGVDVWSDVTVRPFGDCFLHVSRDTSRSRAAAEALEAAELRFRNALESLSETVAVFRPIRDASGRFLDAEVVFANRVGRERWLASAPLDQVVGRMLFASWPHMHPVVFDIYAQVVEHDAPFAGLWESPAGRVYDLRVSLFPGGFVHTSMDITDRLRIQEELRHLNEHLEQRVGERTAELGAAYEELATFTRTASHDLRAPLRAIHGFATIVTRRYREQLDDEGRHYLDNIAQSSLSMGLLLDDLLDYARLGRQATTLERVELEPIVDRVRSVLHDRIATSCATIEVCCPLAVPLGDATLLERILVNLVDNACTYHRPDVPPTIRIGAVAVDGAVEVSVTDDGIGIPAEQQEAVFEVFTRLHSADVYPGTGIGLSIVRRAARLMGSEVLVDSAPGQGATFRLRLPEAETGVPAA